MDPAPQPAPWEACSTHPGKNLDHSGGGYKRFRVEKWGFNYTTILQVQEHVSHVMLQRLAPSSPLRPQERHREGLILS